MQYIPSSSQHYSQYSQNLKISQIPENKWLDKEAGTYKMETTQLFWGVGGDLGPPRLNLACQRQGKRWLESPRPGDIGS